MLFVKLYYNIYGWYYRKKFNKYIKQKLLNLQNLESQNFLGGWSNESKQLLNTEKFYTKSFDTQGWKKYYSEKEYFQIINIDNYTKSYYTKHLIKINDNQTCFYQGFLNINNQKNGKGTLITKESKFEGYWMNDELYGWGIITNANGYIYEGKYISNWSIIAF